MSRLLVLIILAVVFFGGLFVLSSLPKQQPLHPIETAVPQGAGGNAQ